MLKKPVYVWQTPIRIYHWLNVLLITTLLLTGIYIGHPFFSLQGEAYQNFLMGRVRLWHTMAAWIFISNFIFRLYWAWAGNEYSRYKPWTKEFWADCWDSIKYYLFFKKEHTLHIGHNAVAQLTYFIIIWLGSFFMIITGLAMQGEMLPGGLRGRWTGWMIHFFAGQSYEVRSWHHLIAWLFVGFIVVHLYMVIRQDILDDDSTVSAIINGHKFVIVEGENADEPK